MDNMLKLISQRYTQMNEAIVATDGPVVDTVLGKMMVVEADGEVVDTVLGKMMVVDDGIIQTSTTIDQDQAPLESNEENIVSKLDLTSHGKEIVRKVLANRLGTKHTVTYVKDVGNDKRLIKKEYEGKVDLKKKTTADVRNVSYQNTSAVKNARESGDKPVESAGLRGFEWVIFPVVQKAIKTGKIYLSFKMTSAASVWVLDGKEVPKDEVEQYLKPQLEREISDIMIITINPEIVEYFK